MVSASKYAIEVAHTIIKVRPIPQTNNPNCQLNPNYTLSLCADKSHLPSEAKKPIQEDENRSQTKEREEDGRKT